MTDSSDLAMAFSEVLPDDRDEMSRDEIAEYLMDHQGAVDDKLRELDVLKSDIGKALLNGFYTGDVVDDTTINSDITKAVGDGFQDPKIPDASEDSNPSLRHFYY